MASRGEVDGPAVFECDLAMASWRAKRATEEVDRLRREHPTPKPARTAASS